MSGYRIKYDISPFEVIDEYTKRISRVIDEQTLANVENRLAEYGYEKVVRCKDCAWFDPYTDEDADGLCVGACYYFAHHPKINSDGFCYWAVKNEKGA